MIHWSHQQDAAIAAVRAWLADKSAPQVFRLFGYAGTGKTTLAQEISKLVKGTVLYATFTGKAALVLRKKGCDDASTIHSLIYKVEVDPVTGEASFILNPESALAEAKLLIVDEVSMVPEILARDLLSFGVRILVLGDPAQLPPIDGEGFFINATPDIMLTEVHRQARDNPIIRMSMDIREGKPLRLGTYGESRVIAKAMQRDVIETDQLLCGLNRSRVTFNRKIRKLKGLLNGSLWEAETVDLGERTRGDPLWEIRARSLDEERDPHPLKVLPHFFEGTEAELHWKERRAYHEFTFGWAITCHKAQGSQWDSVIVFDESGAFREHRQNWLYTAVTRAAERVTVVL